MLAIPGWVRRLFSGYRIPGWVFVAIGVAIWTVDWIGRLEWLRAALRDLHLGAMASLLTAPLFVPALVVVGFAVVLLADVRAENALHAENEALKRERDELRQRVHAEGVPREIILRTSGIDRMQERFKEREARREAARKREGSQRLAELREKGRQLRAKIDAYLVGPSIIEELRSEMTAWFDEVRNCLVEYASPHNATWVLSAPFEGAPAGFDPEWLPVVREPVMLACVGAILARLDEVLRDY